MQTITRGVWGRAVTLAAVILAFHLLPLPLHAFEVGVPEIVSPTDQSPIEDFTAFDTPNDAGGSVSLAWHISPLDQKGNEYVVYGANQANGPWKEMARLDSTRGFKSDFPELFGLNRVNKQYHFCEIRVNPDMQEETITATTYFRLEMVSGTNKLAESVVASAAPAGNWFDTSKINILVFVILFSTLIIVFISIARRNRNLFIRHIPGLDAIEEAIGRATEMGRPVLYLNGLSDMSSLSTIASTSILAHVARQVANYDSQLRLPSYDPIVMSVCQEVVREAYLEAGRPDAFKNDNIFYVSNDQFAYAAAVDGMIMRERPAANIFMGYYYAESLLLAEAGAVTGAIQIAGTDAITQLPFFITTCDYTLIGEELYAAGAYLSREPLQLGSLKGQDVAKGVILLVLLAGAALATGGITIITELLMTF